MAATIVALEAAAAAAAKISVKTSSREKMGEAGPYQPAQLQCQV
jgi:hypothetical protein